MTRECTSSNGINVATILFLIFLVLKLTHYIDWSWWWVTAPLWLPITVIIGVFGICVAIGGIILVTAAIISTILERKK